MDKLPVVPDWLVDDLEGPRVSLDDTDVNFSRRARSAWSVYLVMAAAIQPEVIISLITDEAVARVGAARDAGRGRNENYEWTTRVHILGWCRRWGFNFGHAELPAYNTILAALDAVREGDGTPTNFVCDASGVPLDGGERHWARNVSHRIFRPFILEPELPLPRRYELLDGRPVVHEEVRGHALWIDANELHWQPERESRTEARDRIVASLRFEVEAELDRIESEYVASGYCLLPRRRVSGTQTVADIWIFARHRIADERPVDIERALAGQVNSSDPDHDPMDAIHREVARAIDRVEKLLGIPRR